MSETSSIRQYVIRENPYLVNGNQPPIPYNEPQEDPIEGRWKKESWEDYLKNYSGFITDYIAATRGIMAPSKFFAWAAITLLSSICRRDVYLGWHFDNLYPNLYTVLVAIPGVCKKTTAVRSAKKIAEHLPEYVPTKELQYKTFLNIHQGKATPEALQDLLQPIEWAISNGDGAVKIIKRGSQLSIMIGELTDFLGRQKQNTGLTTKLVTLYDCEDKASDQTRGGGAHPLEDIYVTLLSATTKSAIEHELPEEARLGGFMSRTLIIYQDYPTRKLSIPIKNIPGAPSLAEMTKRLAWIAVNHSGEYILSKEVLKVHDEWFSAYIDRLVELGDSASGFDRMDIQILKVALLIRISRYEPGNEITLNDYLLARDIVTDVYAYSQKATEDLGTTPQMKQYHTVKNYIEGHIATNRLVLTRAMSPRGILTDDVTRCVLEMKKMMLITIYRDGREVPYPSSNTKEIYVWAEYDDGSQDWEIYLKENRQKKKSGRPQKKDVEQGLREDVQRSLNSSDSHSPISQRPTKGMAQSKLQQKDSESQSEP